MRLNPRVWLGRLPFRTRLAAAFSALFLFAGILLLAFVVVLARYGTSQQINGMSISYGDAPYETVHSVEPQRTFPFSGDGPLLPGGVAVPPGNSAEIQRIDQTVQAVQDTALRQMVLWSAVGLLVLALLAGLLGWWLAGRTLRPVASMTEAARRISEQNLHQRLALTGPDDELHRLADTFDNMLDRLEKSFESQRRFVANASHELKTPLAVQRTTLQVGLADPLPDGLADVRDDLLTANREAEQLINALLLLARGDRGLEETKTVDLVAMVRLVAAELTPKAVENAVRVEVSASTPMMIPGDPVLMRHLLTNLMDNAIQYNEPGGHVRVRLDAPQVTVTNTGPHIPADRIPSLFEPFRRLAGDRTSTTGHGLGLSIAASIAEAHGATLEARPATRGGLTVTLRLPRLLGGFPSAFQ